ncbi:hypothetical protein [Vibrio parahaemolyticus]|uniref:hypothetical protein n=1 Tax=Vibrio parahaemolyticus TaxID=670 RepID=UPI00226BB6D7|nr:hypothetical protein [Vibrio parahaemolyticus]MCX8941271.1 hypothetical protein [Vibrio parahaemolyticus]
MDKIVPIKQTVGISRDGYIMFLNNRSYAIHSSEIKTADDVVDWIEHLSEKDWFTRFDTIQFCQIAMTLLREAAQEEGGI